MCFVILGLTTACQTWLDTGKGILVLHMQKWICIKFHTPSWSLYVKTRGYPSTKAIFGNTSLSLLYILGTDRRLLHNVAVRDARHNTDHYLVVGCLYGAAPAAHLRYLGKRMCFLVNPTTNMNGVDCQFAELRGGIPNPPRRERLRQAWISLETWRLINTRIASRRSWDQRISRTVSRTIKAILQGVVPAPDGILVSLFTF